MAIKPTERIALDSVVVIDLLDHSPGRYEWIKPILVGAEAGELVIVFCAMGIAETVGIKGKTTDQSRAIIKEFFDKSWVVPLAVSIQISELAVEIQREHPADCADAIHLAASIISKSPYFLTNDGDNPIKKKRKAKPLLPLDKKLVSDKFLIDGKPLRIVTPQSYHEIQVSNHNPILQKP